MAKKGRKGAPRDGKGRFLPLHEINDVSDFAGGLADLDDLEALITKESLKTLGIADAAGFGHGAAWAAALKYIPDFPGALGYIKALAPALVGGGLGLLLMNKNLPLAASLASSGAALTGAFLTSDLLLGASGNVSFRALPAAPTVETPPVKGIASDEDLFGLLNGVTPVADFEDAFAGDDVATVPQFAGFEVGQSAEFEDIFGSDDDLL